MNRRVLFDSEKGLFENVDEYRQSFGTNPSVELSGGNNDKHLTSSTTFNPMYSVAHPPADGVFSNQYGDMARSYINQEHPSTRILPDPSQYSYDHDQSTSLHPTSSSMINRFTSDQQLPQQQQFDFVSGLPLCSTSMNLGTQDLTPRVNYCQDQSGIPWNGQLSTNYEAMGASSIQQPIAGGSTLSSTNQIYSNSLIDRQRYWQNIPIAHSQYDWARFDRMSHIPTEMLRTRFDPMAPGDLPIDYAKQYSGHVQHYGDPRSIPQPLEYPRIASSPLDSRNDLLRGAFSPPNDQSESIDRPQARPITSLGLVDPFKVIFPPNEAELLYHKRERNRGAARQSRQKKVDAVKKLEDQKAELEEVVAKLEEEKIRSWGELREIRSYVNDHQQMCPHLIIRDKR